MPQTNIGNLPLTALKAFEAVGRHCHIRKAALEMHVSHPALSRQVRQLEERLGIALFYRQGNRLTLTAAGKRLLVSVQKAFEQINRGILHLDPKTLSGPLIIASTPTIAMSWLLRIVTDFQHNYPEIDFKILTIEPKQRILPSEFDLAICLGKPDDSVRRIEYLYDEQYIPVCSPQLLVSNPVNLPEDLNQLPLLHDRLDSWQQWFSNQSLALNNAQPKAFFDHAYQAIEAARLGMGVALADPVEIREDLKSGRLMKIIEPACGVGQSVFVVCDEEDKQPLRTQLLIKAIKHWVNDSYEPVVQPKT